MPKGEIEGLVERLRRTVISAPDINGGRRQVPLNPDGPAAADALERLSTELNASRELLKAVYFNRAADGSARLGFNLGSYGFGVVEVEYGRIAAEVGDEWVRCRAALLSQQENG